MHPKPSLSSWAWAGLYLFGVVLVLSPMADLVTSVLPVRPGDYRWRYGTLGLAAGYLHTPMLGFALIMGLAFALEHTRVLRLTAVLGILAALSLLVIMGVFALDVVQVMGLRTEDARGLVLLGGFLQEVKYLSAAGVLGLLGLGGWKTAGQGTRAPKETARMTPGLAGASKSR